MWISRDKDGRLWIGHIKPIRCGKDMTNPEKDICQWDYFYNIDYYEKNNIDEMCLNIPSTMFPNLKWDDEPIEVKLVEIEKQIQTRQRLY